jgi:hypothetical protein
MFASIIKLSESIVGLKKLKQSCCGFFLACASIVLFYAKKIQKLFANWRPPGRKRYAAASTGYYLVGTVNCLRFIERARIEHLHARRMMEPLTTYAVAEDKPRTIQRLA